MSAASHDDPEFATAVGIVGVGLIGGSIAAALKKRRFAGQIVGLGRNTSRVDRARQAGLIDAVAGTPRELAERCNLMVVCTPVDRIVEDARALAEARKPHTLITDAGSTKQEICRELSATMPEGVTFIGSHPLAGSEKQGFEHADAALFENRVCVITPDAATPPTEAARLQRFWEYLGCKVVVMSSEAHDRALAQTSHVPHLAAAAIALSLAESNTMFAASGFRDATRIAAGDPELWTAIVMSNRTEIAQGIRTIEKHLSEIRDAVEHGDVSDLRGLLQQAKTNRDALDTNSRESFCR